MPRVVIVSPSERKASFRFGQRLHRPEEFSAVMSARRVVRGDSFNLHYRPVGTENGTRLGLIVPKSLARAASVRNSIKRQGREAFRLMVINMPSCEVVLRLIRPVKAVRARDCEQRKKWRVEIESLLRGVSSGAQ